MSSAVFASTDVRAAEPVSLTQDALVAPSDGSLTTGFSGRSPGTGFLGRSRHTAGAAFFLLPSP